MRTPSCWRSSQSAAQTLKAAQRQGSDPSHVKTLTEFVFNAPTQLDEQKEIYFMGRGGAPHMTVPLCTGRRGARPPPDGVENSRQTHADGKWTSSSRRTVSTTIRKNRRQPDHTIVRHHERPTYPFITITFCSLFVFCFFVFRSVSRCCYAFLSLSLYVRVTSCCRNVQEQGPAPRATEDKPEAHDRRDWRTAARKFILRQEGKRTILDETTITRGRKKRVFFGKTETHVEGEDTKSCAGSPKREEQQCKPYQRIENEKK